MLTVQEYQKAFSLTSVEEMGVPYPGTVKICEGLLQFTDETACCWGGPYPGNYAQYVVYDYTNAVSTYKDKKGKKVLDILEAREDLPSKEFPIRLWMFGNDDTSYSKFYKSKHEVMEELQLFAGNQPLDFHDVVQDFGFVFTN